MPVIRGQQELTKAAFRNAKPFFPCATVENRELKTQKSADLADYPLYFKDSNLGGANLTFLEDLYLPLFVGDVWDARTSDY
jgi:hypothetical protein